MHELRNTLFALSANLEALELGTDDPAEVRESCQVLRAEHERLATLTRDLAELGRPGPSALDAASLKAVLEGAALSSAGPAEGRGVRIRLEIDGEWHVRMEPDRLRLAFERLLAAVCRLAPKGGAIRIVAQTVEREGKTWVRTALESETDAGGAEPPADPFAPYSRWSARGDRLGLAIARRIVAEHGGRVSAARTGRGATLCVELPGVKSG